MGKRALLFIMMWCVGLSAAVKTGPTGHEVGNGGNVVVCRGERNRIETVRLLDYYVARLLLPELVLSLGEAGDELEKVRFVLNRLRRVDFERAEDYLDQAEKFFENVRFIDKVLLPDTQDYGLVPLEQNCRIEQLAIQKEPTLAEQKLYTINRDLWNRLSKEDQAGLILHEIIYREALKKGQKNSINSRYYNALVSSTKLLTISLQDYGNEVGKLGFSVDSSVQPPVWIANPVVLAGAKENRPYRASVAKYAHSMVSEPLTFQKVSGPAWAMVGVDGSIMGTPKRTDIGDNRFVLRATTPDGFYADGNVVIRVHSEVQIVGVKWKTSPIDLGLQIAGKMWAFDLRNLVTNPFSEEIRFIASKLPKWMSLSSEGILSGIPQPADIGKYRGIRLSVASSDQGEIAEAFGEVLQSVLPPKWIAGTIVLPDVLEDTAFSQDLLQYVHNFEGVSLKFSIIGGPSWLTVSASGVLSGIPRHKDVGMSKATLQVSSVIDGVAYSDTTETQVLVIHTNHAPIWYVSPLIMKACVDKLFTVGDLGASATDSDGDVLAFSMSSPPKWLAQGSGIPSHEDIGDHEMGVYASDGILTTANKLVIQVIDCR